MVLEKVLFLKIINYDVLPIIGTGVETPAYKIGRRYATLTGLPFLTARFNRVGGFVAREFIHRIFGSGHNAIFYYFFIKNQTKQETRILK